MKKNKYIQPRIELVSMQHVGPLCASDVVDNESVTGVTPE